MSSSSSDVITIVIIITADQNKHLISHMHSIYLQSIYGICISHADFWGSYFWLFLCKITKQKKSRKFILQSKAFHRKWNEKKKGKISRIRFTVVDDAYTGINKRVWIQNKDLLITEWMWLHHLCNVRVCTIYEFKIKTHNEKVNERERVCMLLLSVFTKI